MTFDWRDQDAAGNVARSKVTVADYKDRSFESRYGERQGGGYRGRGHGGGDREGAEHTGDAEHTGPGALARWDAEHTGHWALGQGRAEKPGGPHRFECLSLAAAYIGAFLIMNFGRGPFSS